MDMSVCICSIMVWISFDNGAMLARCFYNCCSAFCSADCRGDVGVEN